MADGMICRRGGASGGSGSTDMAAFLDGTISSMTVSGASTFRPAAFVGCSQLAYLDMPSVTTIPSFGLSGLSSTLETAVFSGCTTIANNAFQSCTALTSLSFPACTTIQKSAFQGCTSLSSVYFPSCTSLSLAFDGCTSLKTVHFPACTTIESGTMFNNCPNVESVEFNALTTFSTGLIPASTAAYHLTTLSFPAVTGGIGGMSGRTALTTVNFNAATALNNSAFYGCASLTSVQLNAVQTIGASAFGNCTLLPSLSIPNCSSFNTNNTFLNCSALSNLTVGLTITVSNQFSRLTGLTTLTMPSCSQIAASTFASGTIVMNTDLKSVYAPVCTSIGASAFAYHASTAFASIQSTYFPACETIGTYAFRSCTYLSQVNFPAAKDVQDYAFYQCTSLTTAIFGQCATMSAHAFDACSALASLYLLGSSVCTVNADPFSTIAFSSTGKIYVKSSLVTTYQTATYWSNYSSLFTGV